MPEKAKEGREDLRNVALVTIDGADAKDFDDAVYCEPQGDGWRLLVAIADVSHYVRPDSPLDKEARGRGTSVYFPDRVVPMLPEELSNGLCSLKPHVDRLCLVCEMQVTRAGEVTRSRFYDAVMRSAARLTYTEAAGMLVAARPRGENAELKPALQHLNAVYEAFAAVRKQRGAIDFDMPETKIELDERGQVRSVRAVERLVTHKIIEECMIAANVEAAKRINKGRIAGLYRVHEGPDEGKLEELVLFLRTFGHKLTPSKVTPKEINRILASVSGKPEEELVETVVLRSMMQARYQPGNVGHFGLALGAYAHFTSPIRRYPDLLVHRAIKWLNDKRSAKGYRYALPEMEQLGEHCSRTERRADEATREVAERLKCVYLKERVGETFDVVISSVVPFGLFVRLPEVQADGLVHVTALPRDYYHKDPTGTTLKGERSGREYRLTETLKVRLAGVNVEERKVDFVPVDNDNDQQAPAPKRRRRGRGVAASTCTACTLSARCSSGGRRPCSRRKYCATRAASSRSSQEHWQRAVSPSSACRAPISIGSRRAACTKASWSKSQPRLSFRSAISKRSSSSAAEPCGYSCSTVSRIPATSAPACARPTRRESMRSSCPRTIRPS